MCVSSSLDILLNRCLIVNRKLGADPNRKLGANNDVWYQPHGIVPYVCLSEFRSTPPDGFLWYGIVPTIHGYPILSSQEQMRVRRKHDLTSTCLI